MDGREWLEPAPRLSRVHKPRGPWMMAFGREVRQGNRSLVCQPGIWGSTLIAVSAKGF